MSSTAQPPPQPPMNGMIPGIIACVMGALGILFLGTIFVPIGSVIAAIGTWLAIQSKNLASMGVNALGWVLLIIGLATSPLLLALIGLSSVDLPVPK